jgi:hypothetical protein
MQTSEFLKICNLTNVVSLFTGSFPTFPDEKVFVHLHVTEKPVLLLFKTDAKKIKNL